jgi:hypothetical protein
LFSLNRFRSLKKFHGFLKVLCFAAVSAEASEADGFAARTIAAAVDRTGVVLGAALEWARSDVGSGAISLKFVEVIIFFKRPPSQPCVHCYVHIHKERDCATTCEAHTLGTTVSTLLWYLVNTLANSGLWAVNRGLCVSAAFHTRTTLLIPPVGV